MKLEIAEPKRFDVKIIGVLAVLGFFWLLGRINDHFQFWNDDDKPLFAFLITVFVTVPLIYLLLMGKNYKSLGYIKLGSDKIIIQHNKKTKELNFDEIDLIKIDKYGAAGDLVAPWLGGFMSAYGKDGSGNIITFLRENDSESVNVVFESSTDYTALKLFSKGKAKTTDLNLK
jgi:hypothetical protein